MPDLDLTPEEIEELAGIAQGTYHEAMRLGVCPAWREVVRAVLRKWQAMYLDKLARALQEPDSAASKLRDELRDLRCPHCGKQLEDEPEECDRRG